MRACVRENIREMVPYQAPSQLEGIKLDANENIYPVPKEVRMHLSKWALTMPINYYPDTENTKLREVIATFYGKTMSEVTVGVGSDQLISCLLEAFVGKGDYVLTAKPSFSMYGLGVALKEGELIEVPFKEDFNYDVEVLEAAIQQYQPKVTFICQPNNPTGSVMTVEEMQRLIEKSKGIVVVDEAYGEFCDISALSLTSKYENVVVLRTFSKAYGLAGARVGYAIGSEAVISWINCVKPPYALNRFSEEIACYMMTHYEIVDARVQQIKETRDWVSSQLSCMKIEVFPSQTNFLWFKTALPVQEALAQKKIYIKQWKGKYSSYYRMSIGTDAQMLEVVEQIRQIKEVADEASRVKKTNL